MGIQGRSQRAETIDQQQASKILGRLMTAVDNFQLSHRTLAFGYAVLKKYSEDDSGNLAALITYYGFLSLFPLLVAALSFAELTVLKSTHLKTRVISALNNNFPLIGHQLQSYVHSNGKTGIALGISLLLTIYGSRGVSSALRQAMDHVWQVPLANRTGGVKGTLKSIEIIVIGGLGFIITGILSSYGAGRSGAVWLRIIAIIASTLITFLVLLAVYRLSLSFRLGFSNFVVGALIASVGLQIIQAAGGFIITHELRHFSSLYGSLALVFVLLFWIYLQVRILLYATEVDSIIRYNLWPRSITGFRLTMADKTALSLQAKKAALYSPPTERVKVKFK